MYMNSLKYSKQSTTVERLIRLPKIKGVGKYVETRDRN